MISFTCLKFEPHSNILLLSIYPGNNIFKNTKLLLTESNQFYRENSVIFAPFQSLKIQPLKLVIVIKVLRWVILKQYIKKTIIDKSISYSYEIVNNVGSWLLVETKHELVSLLILNIHHHFECEEYFIPKTTKRECANLLHLQVLILFIH